MQRLRKILGISALFSGVLAGLSSFLMVPKEIGLCNWGDYACIDFSEKIGSTLFVAFMLFFVMGTLIFVHSRKDRKRLIKISSSIAIFGVLIYLTASSSHGAGWGPSLSARELIGWPITILYSSYIVVLALKEIFHETINRFGVWKLVTILVVVIFVVFILVAGWL